MTVKMQCPYCTARRDAGDDLRDHINTSHRYSYSEDERELAFRSALPDTLKRDGSDFSDPDFEDGWSAPLDRRLDETGERLDKAGAEIAALKAQAEAVQRRLDRLDLVAEVTADVRRKTLEEVHRALGLAGHHRSAVLVARKIRGEQS